MTHCERPEMSERLIMALAPDEFPQDAREIEEHLKQCRSCRSELDAMKCIDKVIREHKAELSDALEPCPAPESLVKYALGENAPENIEDHLSLCPTCSEQVSLIAELRQEPLNETIPITPEARALILKTVSEEFRTGRKPVFQFTGEFWHRFVEFFHIPSLAAGAAVALLCFLIVAPFKPEEVTVSPALSKVTWTVSPSVAAKGPSGAHGPTGFTRKGSYNNIAAPRDAVAGE